MTNTILLLANSLAYYDRLNRWYDVADLKEDERYPIALGAKLCSTVVCYAEPWLTMRDAPSRVQSIPPQKCKAFILQVGIVEAVPRIYPIGVRRMINALPVKQARRQLNGFESVLIRVLHKKSSWISPREFRTRLKETVQLARGRFRPQKVILVGIFHVGSDLERKVPGTNRNVARLNSELERFSDEFCTHYLDADHVFDDNDFLSDRIHMNVRGHELMAELLASLIRSE